MSKSNVSIIIPAYVVAEEALRWLAECLDSACKQKCEVVVYNDGSPYNITPVISKFPVEFIGEGINHGVSYARNRAIEYADTECILPLDCDDRISIGAVDQLYDLFVHNSGTPIYPDVSKFGDETDPHYELLDFSCDNITKYVGFSSVNVLHSKRQWKEIGGYDENLMFYEDGEYNARLFSRYCGVRCPHPLIEYRIHPNQRTKQYDKDSRKFALVLLERIRRLEMACPGCGKRRTQGNLPSGTTKQMVQQMAVTKSVSKETTDVMIGGAPANLPIMFEGKYLAVYIGGQGRGKHYYNGITTKQPYKVSYGDYVYVDIKDARKKDDQGSRTMFVLVEEKKQVPPPAPIVEVAVKNEPAPAPVAKQEEQPVSEPARVPRVAVQKTPVDKKKKR